MFVHLGLHTKKQRVFVHTWFELKRIDSDIAAGAEANGLQLVPGGFQGPLLPPKEKKKHSVGSECKPSEADIDMSATMTNVESRLSASL